MLYADERERLPLWAHKAVTLLVVGELVLVIRVLEEPLPGLGHHHLLASTGTFFQVTPGEISGIGQRRLRFCPGRLFGPFHHRRQQGIVIGFVHNVHGGDQHAGRSPSGSVGETIAWAL